MTLSRTISTSQSSALQPRRSTRLRGLATTASVALALLALVGCSKKKSEDAAPDASAKVEASLPGDPALVAQLETIAKECTVEPKAGSVNCPKGQQQKLLGEFVSNKRSRVDSLDTLIAALNSSDPKIQAVAASVLHGAFRGNMGRDVQPGSVKVEQARRLVDTLPKLQKAQAREAAPAAVHAAVLAKDYAHLYEVLDKDQVLAPAGYRYLMVHGRLETFDKVKELTNDKRGQIVLAAMDAPRNMPNWTDAERAAICPWALPLLSNENNLVASKAAGLLSQCTGEFVDALLTEGEKALADKKLSKQQISAFRDLCNPMRRRAGGATDEQCKRNRKLLEDAAKLDALDAGTRAMALSALAYQWPDPEALALAKTLAKSDKPEVAQAANQSIARIEGRSAPGVGPMGPHGGPGAPGVGPMTRPPVPPPPGSPARPVPPPAQPTPAAPPAGH